ncbi:MAG: bifunctional D-glycero-beta-D-manno-heptose-7-phosphate kinase/D-glycero-beta-D-manno-heptose 1-phosphate adenylyltransferase HldE [Desulfovibrio sp.]|nr:bifunctional D-glycero-beta-D-manno-heptose-7-phosphate kinase/D-glycero-beta-D-manno-heptose 1-phosphate adenylyltransferase HldE [Desulfovibrio sp.]
MDFSSASALAIGDVMLDHYITGTTERVSPEAPVPVVNKRNSWAVPGGAANVARGLSRLGCDARLAGLAARDPAGETLRQEVAAEGIRAGFSASRNRPTTVKTRIMARGQQLLRVDEEVIAPPSLEEKVSLLVNFEKLLGGCKAVVLSDYAKGTLLADKDGDSVCRAVIKKAKDAKIPVLVDPKGLNWERYAGAACVTPNVSEFIKIVESLHSRDASRVRDEARVRSALALDLCERFNFGSLLLTRGSKGMELYVPGEKIVRIPAAMREVSDVSGAGDTVIATLAACAAIGMDWEESARTANIAAGIAVGKLGTSPVSIDELNRALREKTRESGVYGLEELLEKIGDWRKKGKKIVFTNGCFDLLHAGHAAVLRQSAELGDKLIVGLNSDASVSRLKGKSRPVQPAASRAAVLSALDSVDAVIVFEEDTPENLIKAIKPDYLVKGGDYAPEDIAGSAFVRSYGGQVRIIPLIEGESTTNIVNRIQAGKT